MVIISSLVPNFIPLMTTLLLSWDVLVCPWETSAATFVFKVHLVFQLMTP
ncbi:MAG: hypothetical protein IPH66_15880 [Crocinitomicaceae bacterium]|nr:hypothetical protein [Crocinitomicaceae bacterium]